MYKRIKTFRVPFGAALEEANKVFPPESIDLAYDPLYVELPDGAYSVSFEAPDVQIFENYARDMAGNQLMTLMLCEKQSPTACTWGMCCNYHRVYLDEDGYIQFIDTKEPGYEEFIQSHFVKIE